MKKNSYILLLAAICGSTVSCKQATEEELTSTLAKDATYNSYVTDDGLYDVTVDTENKTATINYFTDKNQDKSNVTVPSTITYQNAVYKVTSLDGVYFGNNSQVTSITLPDGLETIGESCFERMSIEEINIPESVYEIGMFTFQLCDKLKHIKIPSKISFIPLAAFLGCTSLQSVELPEGMTDIVSDAFACNTKLTSITIPSKVSQICSGAFRVCRELSQVILGAGVKSIGNGAFSGCEKLEKLYSYATNPPTASNIVDPSIYNSCRVFVPEESVDAYKKAEGWKNFENIEGFDPEKTPGAGEQKAAITDESTTIPVGTYEAGNLTYSRTNANFEAGKYVTICLPFNIDMKEVDCFSEVLIPNNIALYNTSSQMLTILMNKMNKASSTTTIPAGTPFLAKLSGTTVELKNSNRTTISSTYAEDLATNMVTKFEVYNHNGNSGVLESNEDLDVRFCGSFEKKTGLDKTKYRTFMSDGRFAKADNIGIFRAYIYKANVEAENSVQALSISTDGVADDIIKGNYTIKGNQLIINK